MVTLCPVTADNWEKCIRLSVREDQKSFVASNLYSLAEAGIYPDCWIPQAIYQDDAMVGFLMYGVEPEDKTLWICRLMINAQHQGRGYGRDAMEQLLARMRAEGAHDTVFISFEPENTAAKGLYESLGFVLTGELAGDEQVMKLAL